MAGIHDHVRAIMTSCDNVQVWTVMCLWVLSEFVKQKVCVFHSHMNNMTGHDPNAFREAN